LGLATLVGRIRVERYRTKHGNRTLHFVDDALGLQRTEVSPRLARLVVALTPPLSYRATARVITSITGERISPQICMRIARTEATHLRRMTGSTQ
jgi:hypothetical protein